MKRIPYTKLLIGILILAAILRLTGLGAESFWLDESITVRWIDGSFTDMLTMVKADVHMPFYSSLLWVWTKIFGISEVSVRFLSVIFGIASVYMTYLIAKDLFGKRVGLLSALFISISEMAIYYSQEARMYSMLLFFSLLSFYYFIKYKKTGKFLIQYIISSVLMFYTHIISILVMGFQNLWYFIEKFKNKKLIKWIISQVITLIILIPGIFLTLKQIKNTESIFWSAMPNKWTLVNAFNEFLGSTILFLLFCSIILYFIYSKRKLDNDEIFIFSWAFFPILILYLISLFIKPYFVTRYLIYVLPAFMILLARAILSIKKVKLRNIVMVVMLCLSLFVVVNQIFHEDKEDWSSLTEYLDENAGNDTILIHPFYQQLPYSYYANKDCFLSDKPYTCNFEKRKVISLDPATNCCNYETRVIGMYRLSDFTEDKVWVVSVREHIYPQGRELIYYLTQTKDITLKKNFGDDLVIYLFE